MYRKPIKKSYTPPVPDPPCSKACGLHEIVTSEELRRFLKLKGEKKDYPEVVIAIEIYLRSAVDCDSACGDDKGRRA
jgi:hypothetical protein